MRTRSARASTAIIGALVLATTLITPAVAAPPKDRLAFVRANASGAKIMTMRSDGKQQRTVKKRLSVVFPSGFLGADLSPDGQRLVYAGADFSNSEFDLWVSKANGKGAKRILTNGAANKFFIGPSWSPDGERIVYAEFRPGKAMIRTIRWDGKQARTVRTFSNIALAPSFSPDGETIVFTRGKGERLKVATMTVTGKKLRTFKGKSNAHDIASGFSPDGKRIALTRLPAGPLVRSPASLFTAGSPSPARLAFTALRGCTCEEADVFTVKANGKGSSRLTNSARVMGVARYTADGKRLLVSQLTPGGNSLELYAIKSKGKNQKGKRLTHTLETYNVFDVFVGLFIN